MQHFRDSDVQLMRDKHRVYVIAPAAEPVVGNHYVDIVTFHNGFNGFVVFPERSQSLRKQRHHLENLAV